MKMLLFALSLFSFQALAADAELTQLKADARHSIERQMKALKSSQSCIDSSRSVKDYKNCNYNPANFNSDIQEEQAQPDTGTSSEPIQTHGY